MPQEGVGQRGRKYGVGNSPTSAAKQDCNSDNAANPASTLFLLLASLFFPFSRPLFVYKSGPYGRAAVEAACDVVRSCALSPECRTVLSQSAFFVDAVAQIRCVCEEEKAREREREGAQWIGNRIVQLTQMPWISNRIVDSVENTMDREPNRGLDGNTMCR